MKLDHMQVAVRPMPTVQAIDLGTMMARHWFVPLWQIWVKMALPFFILLFLLPMLGKLFFADNLAEMGLLGELIHSDWFVEVLFLLFWWLKPIYEKPMVSWMGQALFDSALSKPNPTRQASIQSVIKTGRSLKHGIKPDAGKLLLRHRISTQRQLMLPILQLERPSNEQFKARLNVLQRGQGGGVGWQTIVLVHIESFFALGMLLFLVALIPFSLLESEMFFSVSELVENWAELAIGILYFIGASLIAPFFVAGGFAVYLTKRCLLEGWDVELVFKQLTKRYQQSLNKTPNLMQITSNPSTSSSLSQSSTQTEQPVTKMGQGL